MARTLLARELTSTRSARVHFAIATQADDAEIRRLLRENPIPGQISLSLEREPDYFADAQPDEAKQTIVAHKNGGLVCAGSCTIRQRFVNGEPRRVGYLGGLRLDGQKAGRFDIVRRGYEFFRKLQAEAPADFYFTSIAAGNERAQRFLERGLPGMPQYEFIGEFITILVRTARRTRAHTVPEARAAIVDEFLFLLNEHNRLYQFAPRWSGGGVSALGALGLREEDFHFVQRGSQIVAGAALWDQRKHKQTVVRGYTPWLAFALPALNVAARIIRVPRFPAVGTTLANAFVSHFVCADEPEVLISLVADLRDIAARRGFELLTMGFAANDPRLATVRSHFRCHQYRTRFYVVRWPELGGKACDVAGRVLAPEVGLL